MAHILFKVVMIRMWLSPITYFLRCGAGKKITLKKLLNGEGRVLNSEEKFWAKNKKKQKWTWMLTIEFSQQVAKNRSHLRRKKKKKVERSYPISQWCQPCFFLPHHVFVRSSQWHLYIPLNACLSVSQSMSVCISNSASILFFSRNIPGRYKTVI